jgi:N-acetylglucosaminyl-diphospho-decaprenol L-rhamnosyltransferase
MSQFAGAGAPPTARRYRPAVVSPAIVTVAVVSWNTRALLAQCLDSLRSEAEAGVADVWVIDNASSDGSPALVQESYPWVNLIASEVNLGFGAAVNQVAARTESPWIAPANADVRLAPGALGRLLLEGDAHPEAAVIAPRLILPDGSTQHSVYPFPTIPFTLAYVSGAVARSRRLARYWCIDEGFDPDLGRDVDWAVGAFLLVRRSAWRAVQGFDPEQWMYAEDLDLGWRLSRAGWKARYVPGARVHHAESAATTQAWGAGRHARWHASTYAWMARRRGWPLTRLSAAITVAGYLARAGAATPAARRGGREAEMARRGALESARAHAVGLRPRARLRGVR